MRRMLRLFAAWLRLGSRRNQVVAHTLRAVFTVRCLLSEGSSI
jgi:hypothetical protein